MLKVRLTDGASLSASVIGRDPATDLAVIRAHASYLPCSTLGSSDRLRVNDLIVAINRLDVESVDDLHRFLSEWPLGEPVEMDVVRGDRRQMLLITPEEAGV